MFSQRFCQRSIKPRVRWIGWWILFTTELLISACKNILLLWIETSVVNPTLNWRFPSGLPFFLDWQENIAVCFLHTLCFLSLDDISIAKCPFPANVSSCTNIRFVLGDVFPPEIDGRPRLDEGILYTLSDRARVANHIFNEI